MGWWHKGAATNVSLCPLGAHAAMLMLALFHQMFRLLFFLATGWSGGLDIAGTLLISLPHSREREASGSSALCVHQAVLLHSG